MAACSVALSLSRERDESKCVEKENENALWRACTWFDEQHILWLFANKRGQYPLNICFRPLKNTSFTTSRSCYLLPSWNHRWYTFLCKSIMEAEGDNIEWFTYTDEDQVIPREATHITIAVQNITKSIAAYWMWLVLHSSMFCLTI